MGSILKRRRARMAMNVTVDTLLDRVKDIAPMLRAYAAEAEAQRRLARPVVDAVSFLLNRDVVINRHDLSSVDKAALRS
jgi:hypothetical protein